MIQKKSLYRVSNEELNTVVTRILTAVSAVESLKTGLAAKIIALVLGLNQKLTKSLNSSLKSEYSQLLKSLDKLRDNAFKAIRDSVLGASNRLNESYRLHARKLLAIFRRHGWSLWRDNYQVETSKLISLFSELDAEDAKASVATINMTEWLDELKNAQADFEDAFQNKASGDLRKQYVAMQEIRPELIKRTNELLNQIDSMAKYSDTPDEYTDLVNTINNILAETAIVAKSRKTRNTHNDEEMEEV